MKNKLFFFALFLTLTGLYAQEEKKVNRSDFYLLKGDFIVEGKLGFSNDKDELRGVKTSSYTINPKIGYLISDDFVIGLDLTYKSSKNETEGADTVELVSIEAGPFIRSYFLDLGERFKVYGELGGGYYKDDGEDVAQGTGTGFQVGLDMGINYFVKDNIAISFVLSDIARYQSLTYEEEKLLGETTREEYTNSNLTADLNVFSNFFQSVTFGVMFKF